MLLLFPFTDIADARFDATKTFHETKIVAIEFSLLLFFFEVIF
jgi:hypothetical protein